MKTELEIEDKIKQLVIETQKEKISQSIYIRCKGDIKLLQWVLLKK